MEGITRYQCPRIMAVEVPPSNAADVTKLATVMAATGEPAPAAAAIPCVTRTAAPNSTAVHSQSGRSQARTRPIVAQ